LLLPLVATVLLGACPSGPVTPKKMEPAPEAAKESAAAAEAPVNAPAEVTPEPDKPAPLSEEDLALLAADPKDLTPEMRRKRAYAHRRQIMQNPDSPAARVLKDLAEAHQAGELDVPGKGSGPTFHARGAKPTSGRPPAGWRPTDEQPLPPGAEEAPAKAEGTQAPP